MDTVASTEKKKLHPYQILLWVGIGSIIMMFAGLTSAYIVKKSQANWLEFELPRIFWWSTGVILLSSFTIQMAVKKIKLGDRGQYRGFTALSAILGLLFVLLQIQGYQQLEANHIALTGPRSNSAGSFLLVITGLHLLHMVGGVLALVGVSLKANFGKLTPINALPVELVATFWHFVDILWIYLFVFLMWVS